MHSFLGLEINNHLGSFWHWHTFVLGWYYTLILQPFLDAIICFVLFFGLANFTTATHCCRYWHWKAENQLNPSTSTKKLRDPAAIEVRTAQRLSWISQEHQLLIVLYPLSRATAEPSFHLLLDQQEWLSFSKPLQGQRFSAKRLITWSKKRA